MVSGASEMYFGTSEIVSGDSEMCFGISEMSSNGSKMEDLLGLFKWLTPPSACGRSEVVSKVKISQIQLSNWMFNFISPLQTSPEGAAWKSPSGDLGVLTVSVLSNCKFLKKHNHFWYSLKATSTRGAGWIGIITRLKMRHYFIPRNVEKIFFDVCFLNFILSLKEKGNNPFGSFPFNMFSPSINSGITFDKLRKLLRPAPWAAKRVEGRVTSLPSPVSGLPTSDFRLRSPVSGLLFSMQ